MFKSIISLFNLLTQKQRSQFYALQILIILMAFLEIIGVASIIPFMTLVGDIAQIQNNLIISQVYEASGISSETNFLFVLGVGVLLMLFISAIISMYTIWRLSMFANKIGAEIADRLFTHYLKQNWLFHANRSSAQLTKKIAAETERLTNGVLVPMMQMNARIVLSVFMSLGIFIYDPKVAIIGLVVFAIAYFYLFKVVKVRLQNNGTAISDVNEQRYRLMNEGFGGIKDILLLGRENFFIKSFIKSGKILAYSQGNSQALSLVPRYFMELVAFGSMISLVLYLIASHEGNLGVVLPIFSVYALAIFKLLPAFQQIYVSLATVKSNLAAYYSIQKDLEDSKILEEDNTKYKKNYLIPEKYIYLENIVFKYPTKTEIILNQLNLKISANDVVGIVGASGSGKSTLIDILLSLISPESGFLKIDDQIINEENKRDWQNTIGFVSQSIFLSEGSVAENVAFGISPKNINFDQVEQALKLAHLNEFLETLNNGIHTKVGERGVQLSGGQRQRIGIARALYNDAKVLIFDEATSSLDGITEKMIMNAIYEFSGKKTIILIAHRLKTVQKCNTIFFIEKGQVQDQGTYEELIKKNKNFKKMTENA
jgi:HlyD family secretion protein